MRNLSLAGRRTEALRIYHRLRDVLARRLDVEPQAQTVRLYEAIRCDQAMAGWVFATSGTHAASDVFST